MDQRGYMLRRGAQSVGIAEQCGDRTRHYVMSFDCPNVARKVLHFLHPKPTLRIERLRDNIDITKCVKDDLSRARPSRAMLYSAMPDMSAIVINTGAHLYIPKTIDDNVHYINDGTFHMHNLPMHDVYMMPFTRNVGVLLPCNLLEEDVHEMLFECNIIEPCEDSALFQMYSDMI